MKIPYRNPWLIGAVIIIIAGIVWWYRSQAATKTTTTQQTTAKVEKGTLVQTVSGSGSLTAKVQSTITAPDYGRVDKLLVKDGDEVTIDQPLLQFHSLASDADKAKALASYLSAQDSLNQARTKLTTLNGSAITAQQQLTEAQKNEKIASLTLTNADLNLKKSKIDATKSATDAQKSVADAQINQSKATDDLSTESADLAAESAKAAEKSATLSSKAAITTAQKTYKEAQRDQASTKLKTQAAQATYDAAQQSLKNHQTSLAAAEAQLQSSRLTYQMSMDETVTSPINGRVVNMQIAEGSTVGTKQSSTSTTTTSASSNSTTLFSIVDFSTLRAVIAVSEMDVLQIKPDQVATITFDALSDKTFTGKVVAIDTIGTTTSGVTNYDVEVQLDSVPAEVKPGMNVDVSIITNKKEQALLVPSTAIKAQGEQNAVDVIRNDTTQTVTVTIGGSDDSQTEILSGLNEGDEVVTNPTSGTSTSTSASSSSSSSRRSSGFSLFGGMGGGPRP